MKKNLNSPTTPSCRNPEKPKNRKKTGFFGLPRLYYKKFLHKFDENWLNGVIDIFAPKYEKKPKFAHNAELQEPRKTVKNPCFFQACDTVFTIGDRA